MGTEWFAIIIPLIVVAGFWLFYKAEITILEALLPPVIVAGVILLFGFLAKKNLTTDYEFWTGYVVEARYYEAWDEYIHKTCTETYACGSDSKGNTKYCTRTYDCSYVDDHPAYWRMYDNNGVTFKISKTRYHQLVNKFGGKQKFVDMHRDYHSRDGDMYKTVFTGPRDKLEVAVSRHSYENRVQASNSVYKFKNISADKAKKYGLYDYPKVDRNYKQRHILGVNDQEAERKMELLNGLLGKEKQVKTFIFYYNSMNSDIGEYQRDYLKGANKNEFILCLGKDSVTNEISWVYPITWNTNKILGIDLRDKILENPKMTPSQISDLLYDEIQKNFKRKEFKDFEYLEVELPFKYTVWLWIITAIISIGLGIFIVKNDIRDYDGNRLKYNSKWKR